MGREHPFAYGQRTAESRISEVGGEKVMPEPEAAGVSEAGRGSGGNEADGTGTGTGTLNGRLRILPARSFPRAAALIYKA